MPETDPATHKHAEGFGEYLQRLTNLIAAQHPERDLEDIAARLAACAETWWRDGEDPREVAAYQGPRLWSRIDSE